MTPEMPSARPNERSTHHMDPSKIIRFPSGWSTASLIGGGDSTTETCAHPIPGYPGIFEVSFVRCSLVTTKARTRVNLMSDKLTLANSREKGNTEVNLRCLCIFNNFIGNSGTEEG